MEFGPYELLGRIATGGFSNVYLASQGDQQLVCLKTLRPSPKVDREAVKNFLAEARIAASIEHPKCVRILDLGKARGVDYIAMEYVAGETLRKLLDDGSPMPLIPAISILAAACEGLHHAHDLVGPDGPPANLEQRAVSPQNVMISYRGETKVLDFGIAKAEVERAETRTGFIKGKVRYMSPEQILGSSLDRRSDVYAAGLLMFECLTGRQVFEECSAAQVEYRVLNEDLPPLGKYATVDSQLETICSTALRFKAEDRYPTTKAMAIDLRTWLSKSGEVTGRRSVEALMSARFPKETARSVALSNMLAGPIAGEDVRKMLGLRAPLEMDLGVEPNTDEVDEDDFIDIAVFDEEVSTEGAVDPAERPLLVPTKEEPIAPLETVIDRPEPLPTSPVVSFEVVTVIEADAAPAESEETVAESTPHVEPASQGRSVGVWLLGVLVGIVIGVAVMILLLQHTDLIQSAGLLR